MASPKDQQKQWKATMAKGPPPKEPTPPPPKQAAKTTPPSTDAPRESTPPPSKGAPTKPPEKPSEPPKPVLLDAVITWQKQEPLYVGTTIGSDQLRATEASGAKIKYLPGEGTVLRAGDGQTITATVDDPRYKPSSVPVTVNILRKPRTIIWEGPNPIVVELKQQLPDYKNKAKLSAGDGEPILTPSQEFPITKKKTGLTLTVTAPQTEEYVAPAEVIIPIELTLKPQEVVWEIQGQSLAFTYGLTLGQYASNQKKPLFGAEVKGNPKMEMTYKANGTKVDATTVLKPGNYTFTATSPGSQQFAPTTLQLALTVRKQVPMIKWDTPADITYGTKLNKTEHLTAKLTRPQGEDDKLKFEPDVGAELPVGDNQELKCSYPDGEECYSRFTTQVKINVNPAPQVIEWTAPAPITFPGPLPPAAYQTATVKTGDGGLTFAPVILRVGTVTLTVVAAATTNYTETTKQVDLVVRPPAPPAKPDAKEKSDAKISAEMENKVVNGELKPDEDYVVRGGHSAKVLTNKAKYDAEVEATNDDGTKSVKFKMKLPSGEWSDPKRSTVAPENWNDDAMMGATVAVCKEAAVATRTKDSATLHRKNVSGVEWEVIKKRDGTVTASYPTGGTPTSSAYFINS